VPSAMTMKMDEIKMVISEGYKETINQSGTFDSRKQLREFKVQDDNVYNQASIMKPLVMT
jgi:hypothetical protein